MDQSYSVIKLRMDNAINFINENPNVPTARVIRDFDIPLRRLQRRV